MKRTPLILSLLCLSAGLLSGCDPQFKPEGPRLMPHMISSQKAWTISSRNGQFLNLKGAIDGMNVTAATTVGNYTNATITLDLGRPCMFNLAAILHSTNERGYAGEVSMDTSVDGKTWTHRITVPGTRKVTYFPLMTPVQARYVRFTARKAGRQGWHISEIYFQ